MAQEQNIHKIETPDSLYLSRFWTGLVTNRSPLFTPITALGIQIIQRQDVLIGGANMQITPAFTLQRRYGFLKKCTSVFGSSEWPLTFFSFEQLNGTITPLVDTQTNIYKFTSGSKTSIYTKGTTSQSSFQSVANTLYWCDGTNANKWDGTTVTKMGIVAPVTNATISTTSGSLSPSVGYTYVYSFRNSTTGHLSTASPVSANTGPLTNKNINLGGARSTDTQVDKIWIFRTKDGGGVYYFLAEIANPVSGTWSYTDSTADSGLNNLIIAPVADANDPPPTGISLLTWYAGRLWAASGNTLYFSGGPDTTDGVGEEAWPPGNNFAVPGNITALAPTSQGLVIFTKDNAYVTTGTSSANFTVPEIWQQNLGIISQNNVIANGDTLYFFTSRGQLWTYSSNGLLQIGFNIAAQLAAFTPANSYLTYHANGADEGVFISDGSANIYRYSTIGQSWDTVMQPVGGCGAIMSMELSDDAWYLLMGRPTGSGYILGRDTSTWTDDSSTYTASAIIGSVTVAPPRQVAVMNSVLTQLTATGTYPTVSVMLNEITDLGSGAAQFTALPNPVPDPPQIPQSTSLWTKRHDFKAAQTPLPQYVQHLQIKVAFTGEAYANEILGLGLK
jgi:hypothetical protein